MCSRPPPIDPAGRPISDCRDGNGSPACRGPAPCRTRGRPALLPPLARTPPRPRLGPLATGWGSAARGGFTALIAAGTLVLLAPAASTTGTSAADAFFAAVSAATLTGLTPVPTQDHWTLLGEGAIAAIIVLGGLLYLVGASVLLWLLGRRFALRDPDLRRVFRGAPGWGETLAVVRTVLTAAAGVQALGAAALFLALLGADVPAERALWWGPFHAISAFNNAGFALGGGSYGAFADDLPVLAVTGALAFLGGIGPLPVALYVSRRSFHRLPFDSRVAILAMAAALLAGGAVLFAGEWANGATVGAEPAWRRPFLAVFESAMRTTGLTTLDTAALREESKVLATGLMAIGGAAGSASGGLKVGAVVVLAAGLVAALRGRERLSLLGRELPADTFRRAFAVAFLFGIAAAALVAGLIAAAEGAPLDALFEGVSALSLAGWTTGLTAAAGPAERTLLIAAMLVGRFAPLLLVLQMARERPQPPRRHLEDSIRFG